MARPKEFDPEQALDAAMQCFWEHGFEATSLSALTGRMGVQKASLYATFGDKHALFLKALERYQDASLERMRARLDGGPTALAGIRGFFRDVVAHSSGAGGRRGCLCVNTAIELAPHDAAVAEACRRHTERIERLLEEALERAVDGRELRRDFDCASTARFLVATLHGLSVAAKATPGAKRLKDILSVALSVLDR